MSLTLSHGGGLGGPSHVAVVWGVHVLYRVPGGGLGGPCPLQSPLFILNQWQVFCHFCLSKIYNFFLLFMNHPSCSAHLKNKYFALQTLISVKSQGLISAPLANMIPDTPEFSFFM